MIIHFNFEKEVKIFILYFANYLNKKNVSVYLFAQW